MAYPTGTPVDEQILDDVVAVLGTIAPPSYHTTVRAVERFKPTNATRHYDMPCILLGTPDVTWVDTTNRMLSGEMRFVVRCCVQDRETHQQELAWFAADVRKALLLDWQRGGVALTTRVLAHEPYMIVEEASATAVVDVTVLVAFRHLYDDPNSAI